MQMQRNNNNAVKVGATPCNVKKSDSCGAPGKKGRLRGYIDFRPLFDGSLQNVASCARSPCDAVAAATRYITMCQLQTRPFRFVVMNRVAAAI